MSKEEKSISRIKAVMSSDKGRNIIVIIGIAALLLILLSSRCTGEQKAVKTEDFSTDRYREALSAEILSMVESVEGAGEAKILLTLENSYEYVYLDDEETLQKVIEPQIRGVVVTCKGADSAVVRSRITELLKTALNIPSSKVCVNKLI